MRVKGRAFELRVYSWNLICSFDVLLTGRIIVVTEIVREGGVLRVRDLHSTNGTFVNGQKIDEHRLADGDLVVIADVHFSFRTNRDANDLE